MTAAPACVLATWDPGWREFRSEFEALWLTHLLSHFGEWCHASDALPPEDEYQRAVLRAVGHEVVCAARRLGFIIETDQQLGYRVTGHAGLPRYLHLHERAQDRQDEGVPGQLSLVGERE